MPGERGGCHDRGYGVSLGKRKVFHSEIAVVARSQNHQVELIYESFLRFLRVYKLGSNIDVINAINTNTIIKPS